MQSIGKGGVTIPDNQLAQERAEANTVLAVLPPAEMVPVRYADEHGKVRQVVVLKAGGEYYMPPNAEQWAAQLRPLRDWMKKGIDNLSVTETTEAPTEDSVDIVGSSIAQEPQG